MNKHNYTQLLSDLDKYEETMRNDTHYRDFRSLLVSKIFTRHLYESHGWELPDWLLLSETRWTRINDHLSAGPFEEGSVSWPDDDRQPHGEFLLMLSFHTGPYMFGDDDDYDADFFKEFWSEFLVFGPEYIDTRNHNMWFTPERAGAVTQNFHQILGKYKQLYKEQEGQRRILALKEELKNLGGAA